MVAVPSKVPRVGLGQHLDSLRDIDGVSTSFFHSSGVVSKNSSKEKVAVDKSIKEPISRSSKDGPHPIACR